jgi:hypothetical protein
MTLAARVTVTPAASRRPEDFVARCELVNTGSTIERVNLAPLGSPSLALEVVDAAGAAVGLPPPGVPGGPPPFDELAPGAGATAEFAAFLPQWEPPGAYRVRFRYVAGDVDLRSDWAELRLDP